jgi:hypothetical protein
VAGVSQLRHGIRANLRQMPAFCLPLVPNREAPA